MGYRRPDGGLGCSCLLPPQGKRGRGDVGRDDVAAEEMDDALRVINNWRSSHAFPLNTLQIGLKERAQRVDADALIAQRIKRLSSIKAKLERFRSMDLARMQDIGGCRAVVHSVRAVDNLAILHKSSHMKHRLAGEKDYIRQPEESGYRGVHLVYAYNGRKSTYNDLRIEVQIRSQLQHAWATAVETVGTLTRQALKSSQGSDDWLRFFALMGSALAEREGTSPVPNTPTGKKLVAELKAAAASLNVEPRLRAYGASLRAIDMPALKGHYYFLMRLVPSQSTIHVTGYRQQDLTQASEAYLKAELEIQQDPGAEAVLVSVASLAALRRAYPNYFLDTNKFLTAMRTAIGEKSALN